MPAPLKTCLTGKLVAMSGIAAIALWTPLEAPAQEFCSEPVIPYCVGTESQFDSMLQVNRCKDDLKDFEKELNDYQACITRLVEGMRKELAEARGRLEKEEEKF